MPPGRRPARRAPRAAVLALALGVAPLVAACSEEGGDAPPVDPAAVAGADLAVGRQVYEQRCAVCHGRDGGGGVGPSLRDVGDDVELHLHVDVVRDGRQGMPAFGDVLSDDEIFAVVRYEREAM